MEQGNFKAFVSQLLLSVLPEAHVSVLVSPQNLETYFLAAFTSSNFIDPDLDEQRDYEILEKIGDRVLEASFQLWLYNVMGEATNISQAYSDINKRYTGTVYLNQLALKLQFDSWIRIKGEITEKVREDVFEAFVGAIVLSTNDLIAKDLGFVYAKRWIYLVLNVFLRAEIDVSDIRKYMDFRSRVNEVWQVNNWTKANYKIINNPSNIIVNLLAPNTANIPEKWRGKLLGVGNSKILENAKEEAAEEALITLTKEYKNFLPGEARYEFLEEFRIKRDLKKDPALLAKLEDFLENNKNVYDKISINSTKLGNFYSAQIRVKVGGYWKNEVRGRGKNKLDAITDALSRFMG